jgi:putative Holliday junction resolvase
MKSEPPSEKPKPVLGVDLGSARIGLAVSDDLLMMAHPLETIKATADSHRVVAAAAERAGADTIVVGLPRNMDGSYGPAAEAAKAFAERMKGVTARKIVLQDERLTTVAAQKSLHAAGRDVRKSRPVIDQVAAQLILQTYLDSRQPMGF